MRCMNIHLFFSSEFPFILTSDQVSRHYSCQMQSVAGSILLVSGGLTLTSRCGKHPQPVEGSGVTAIADWDVIATLHHTREKCLKLSSRISLFSCLVFHNHVGLNCPWMKRHIDVGSKT